MTKANLRKKYKLLRNKLSLSQIDDYSISISNQLLKLPIWDADYYHVFLANTSQNEVNTDFILNILSGKDKNILISKSDFSTLELTHYLLTDATKIKLNAYNIPEPVNGIIVDTKYIEVVFVPLLAFDQHGHRVGYGKGFYDRFLAQCSPDTIKIGLSFFEAEPPLVDVLESDIALDFCVTPDCIYRF
jgi:5-formyltetrahydrofolate cyclo-ligase